MIVLEIKTWSSSQRTLSCHHYGVLRRSGERPIRLERVLDEDEAEWLNVYDNTPGMYHAGSTTERFRSDAQVLERAQEMCRELGASSTELVVKRSVATCP